MMRTGWLTGILLALGVIVLVAVPQLRDSLDLLRYNPIGGQGTWLSKAEVERVAQQNPQDPQIWLGFAECGAGSYDEGRYWNPTYPWDQSWSPKEAYQRAIALAPNSPVPHLRYALHFLADWGSLGRKEGWHADIEEPEHTAAEMENLHQAEGMITRARKLDPDNAACDYLLAYIHLARHQDKQAFAFLRETINKPHWSLGSQAATKAVLRLLEATASASPLLETYAISMGFERPFVYGQLRSLAVVLAGFGEQFQARGQHQQAILCYEAGVHLGHVMRRDAYTLIDGLVALAITHVTGGPFLSEEERQQIEKEMAITAGPIERDRVLVRLKRHEETRVANFGAYMKEQGRPDLGELYRKEIQAANQWKERCRAALDRDVPLSVFFYGWLRYSRLLWLQTGLLLVLWVLVGLISVISRYWREEKTGVTWTWWQWLVLVGLVLLSLRLLVPWEELLVYSPFYPYPIHVESALLGIAGILGGWLVLVLVLTLLKRARQTPDQRLGKVRIYIGSLRRLLPLTLAALFLLSVASLWPARQSLVPWRTEQRAKIQQGEVRYFGMNSVGDQETSSLP